MKKKPKKKLTLTEAIAQLTIEVRRLRAAAMLLAEPPVTITAEAPTLLDRVDTQALRDKLAGLTTTPKRVYLHVDRAEIFENEVSLRKSISGSPLGWAQAAFISLNAGAVIVAMSGHDFTHADALIAYTKALEKG